MGRFNHTDAQYSAVENTSPIAEHLSLAEASPFGPAQVLEEIVARTDFYSRLCLVLSKKEPCPKLPLSILSNCLDLVECVQTAHLIIRQFIVHMRRGHLCFGNAGLYPAFRKCSPVISRSSDSVISMVFMLRMAIAQ